MESITWRQVAALRMRRQHLLTPAPRTRLVDVVREHVAIQAQVMSSAELSLRARVRGLRRDDVRDALWQDRTLVKTWAMRGTLHLVAASEVPELVRGLGTRLGWQSAVWLRYFKVTKQEMVALQDAIGDLLSDEPMTRQELADALATKLGDPAFAERVTSSWGTFLKPAAGRGYLAFGPDRGRNVTFVHPGAWLGIDIPEPVDDGFDAVLVRHLAAFPGASKGELARWWGAAGEPGDRRLEAARRPARPRRSRGHEGIRARRGRRGACRHRAGAGLDRPPPGRLRPVHAVAPEGGRAAAADRPAPARVADGGLDQRGPAVRRRRRGHLDPRDEAQGDDDRAQPVAPAGEGRAGDDRGRGRRRSARSSRPASTSA